MKIIIKKNCSFYLYLFCYFREVLSLDGKMKGADKLFQTVVPWN